MGSCALQTIKAAPANRPTIRTYRVRNDHVDRHGKISLRHAGRRHHLGVGATTQAKL
jgi:hypothetical protein